MAKLLTDKKFQEILKERFDTLKYSIDNLFLEDYLTYDIVAILYPDMDENKIYDIKERKSTIQKIKEKVERNLKKVGYKNLIENYECYKRAMENFDDIIDYTKKEIYEFGKENNLLENPKEATDLVEEFEISKEIKSLSIDKICRLYKESFKIEYSIDYNEYVSTSTHISVQTDEITITFKFEDETEFSIQTRINDFSRI